MRYVVKQSSTTYCVPRRRGIFAIAAEVGDPAKRDLTALADTRFK